MTPTPNRSFLSVLLFCLLGCGADKHQKTEQGSSSTITYPLPHSQDSLLVLLTKVDDDSNKVNIWVGLARAMELGSKYDKGLDYAMQAKALAEKLNYRRGLANALGITGNLHYRKSENEEALKNQLAALKIDEIDQDKVGIQKRYGNIGIIYYGKGDYEQALQYQFKALDLATTLDSKDEIAKDLSNIGLNYVGVGNYPKALDHFLRSLKISTELGDKRKEAMNLGNIGIVYDELADYDKALDYYSRALKMDEELNYTNGTLRQLGNIGNVFFQKKDYASALSNYSKALQLAKKIGDSRSEAINLGNIGSAQYRLYIINKSKHDLSSTNDSSFQLAFNYYTEALALNTANGDNSGISVDLGNLGGLNIEAGKFKDAADYLYRGIALADSIGDRNNLHDNYQMLSELYERSTIPLPDTTGGKILTLEQMRSRSLYYYKRLVSIRDTLFSEENKKQLVRKEMTFEFDKKEAVTKAESNKKDALAKEELKQKEAERNYFIAGFALVLLLAGFIFRSYRQKQKANAIISRQKAMVEEKQKEIIDSIHYAKRIQSALLPTENLIDRNLFRLNK